MVNTNNGTAARPYETGAIPTSCPCERPLPAGVASLTEMLTNARTLGRKGITCGGCGRRWSVESLPASATPAVVSATTPTKAAQDIDLSGSTVVVRIRLRKPGPLRSVRQGAVEVKSTVGEDPSKRATRVRKLIWDHEAYDRICSHDGNTCSGIKKFALPGACGILQDGCHMVPTARLAEVNAWLDEREAQRRVLVEDFAREYTAIINERERELGALFNRADYPLDILPDFRALNGSYIEVDYPTERVNEALQTLDPVRYAKAQNEREAKAAKLLESVTAGARQVLGQFCQDLADRIGRKQKGESKRFVASDLLNEMKEWLAAFKTMNVQNDAQLEALAVAAGNMLNGIDQEDIATDKRIASVVKEGMENITAGVKALGVELAPVRRFKPRTGPEAAETPAG